MTCICCQHAMLGSSPVEGLKGLDVRPVVQSMRGKLPAAEGNADLAAILSDWLLLSMCVAVSDCHIPATSGHC